MFDIPTYTIFKTLTGSRVYGTYTDESDYDYRGVVIPPYEYFVSYMDHFEQFESKQEDITIYHINKFLKLAAANNPNIIELLYIPEKFWITTSWYWQSLVNIRDKFLSQQCYHTFYGYAKSQMKKLFNIDKENEKRRVLIDKIGYDSKNGMHLYRLITMATEVLRDHTIIVERPDKDFLREIRSGNVPYEDLMYIVAEKTIELDKLFESTTLPEKPDYLYIRDMGISIITDFHRRK